MVIDKLPNYGYDNRQLIILSLLSTLLPIIPVIFVLKSDENYVAVYFRYCFPQDKQMSFYSCILPLQIFLSIGITCLLIVIFKLIKVSWTNKTFVILGKLTARYSLLNGGRCNGIYTVGGQGYKQSNHKQLSNIANN